MNKVIKQIKVDVYTPTFYEVIKAQQGDKNSRFVEFVLFNQGEPYIIPDDAIVKLEGQRPNKSPIMKPCTVKGSIISVTLDADLLYYHGISHLKVVLYTPDEKTVLSTIPFTLSVQKNPLDSDKFEKDNYSLLNELILSTEQNIKDLQNHLSDADAHGYDTKISNEVKRATNAEKGLNDDISQETVEREKADEAIANQLNSEITRATSIENNLASAKADKSLIGSANGIAELDATGKVPSFQLPSFVDDVIEGYFYDNKFYQESSHNTEITGEASKIYTDLLTNKIYRWSGSNFVIVSETLALGETSSTAYRGDRGKIAYDHIGDTTKHVSSDERLLWNSVGNKVDKTPGKGLSANDYTTAEKNKLSGIAANASANVQSDWNVTDITSDAFIKNKPTIPDASNLNGKVSKSGDIMTGELVLGKGSTVTRANSGGINGGGKDGYVNFARINLIGTYVDHPFYFKIGGRGYGTVDLSLYFRSNTDSVNDLYVFQKSGFATNMNIYIAKSGVKTWDLYAKKSEAWGSVTVLVYGSDMPDNTATVTFPMTFVPTANKGTNWIEASLGGKTAEADTLDGKHASDLHNEIMANISTNIASKITHGWESGIVNNLYAYKIGNIVFFYIYFLGTPNTTTVIATIDSSIYPKSVTYLPCLLANGSDSDKTAYSFVRTNGTIDLTIKKSATGEVVKPNGGTIINGFWII